MSFGEDKDFQQLVGTLLLKDKLDDLNAKSPGTWGKAKEAFWDNIEKYTIMSDTNELVMPNNTFRLTTAMKRHAA